MNVIYRKIVEHEGSRAENEVVLEDVSSEDAFKFLEKIDSFENNTDEKIKRALASAHVVVQTLDGEGNPVNITLPVTL